jgi:hypothetical protein
MNFVGGTGDFWQGGLNLKAAVTASSGKTATIVANRITGTAPAGMFFEAGTAGFAEARPDHDLRYRWRFGDAGEYSALRADHPQGTDRNIAYGPMAAHTFETPGTYTVLVQVGDGVDIEVGSVIVTVTDPDEVYAGAASYVIAPGGGSVEDAPAGALTHPTLSSAKAHAIGAGRRRARFLFERGVAHDISGQGTFAAAQFDSLYFGAVGTGAMPVVNDTLSVDGAVSGGEVVVTGLSVVGVFDPTLGNTATANGIEMGGAEFTTLHGLEVSGFDTNIVSQAGLANTVISDCSVTNWAQNGIWQSGADRGAVIGCSVTMDAGTVAEYVTDGPGRLDGALGRFVLWHNDLFCAGGAGGVAAPCWRWNTGGQQDVAGVIGFNRMEGGETVLALVPSDPGASDRKGRLLVEKNYLLGSAATGQGGVIGLTFGGTTLRNNILVLPQVVSEQGVDAAAMITGTVVSSDAANDAEPVGIYSNTLVDLRTEAGLSNPAQAFASYDVAGFAHWSALEVVNNLSYAPGFQVPDVRFEPLAVEALFAPRYKGRRTGGGFDSGFATPVTTAASYAPLVLPQTPPLAGPGTVARDDFYSALRDPAPDLGAVEQPVPALDINLAETGSTEIVGLLEGLASLEIRLPSEQGGTFELPVADMTQGPVFVAPPVVAGATYTVGDTLNVAPGLVAYNPDDGVPVASYQWLRSEFEIVGETGTSYEMLEDDDVFGIFLRETSTNAAGLSSVTIDGLAAPAYIEQGVVVDPSHVMTSSVSVGTTADNLLFFSSFRLTGAPFAESMAFSISNTLFFAYSATAVVQVIAYAENTGYVRHNTRLANFGDRVNILVSKSETQAQGYIQLNDTPWQQIGSNIVSTDGGFDLSGVAGFFNANCDIAHYRTAFWTPPSFADISALEVQQLFTKIDGTTQNPIQSVTAFGQPLIDLFGDASLYNSGTHAGSNPAFDTITGTFSNE